MKKIKIILFSILLYSCALNYEEYEEEEFQKIQDLFKTEYNLTLDRDKYKMTYINGPSHSLNLFPGVEVPIVIRSKNPIRYRSKYYENDSRLRDISDVGNNDFTIYKYGELYKGDDLRIIRDLLENEEDIDKARAKIPFFNKTNYYTFFLIIDYFGLRPYVLNELIYDKSKGNDFEKIEQILDKYPGIVTFTQDEGWECGDLNKTNIITSFMFVQDDKCIVSGNSKKDYKYSMEKIKEYGKKFEEYFSKERNLKDINWDEFMKYNNITPIIQLNVVGRKEITKKQAQRILDEISPYYNKKTYIITIDAEDENGNLIFVW